MKREIEAMSDRELLMELVEEKRRAEKWRAVRLCAALMAVLALVVLCAIYLPRITETLRRADETMDKVQSMTSQAQEFFDAVNGIGADKLAETVENVNRTAEEAGEIMDKLSDAGLDTLQQTISDLSRFAERIRDFFGG